MGLRGGFDFAGLILFVHGYWRWKGGWLFAWQLGLSHGWH